MTAEYDWLGRTGRQMDVTRSSTIESHLGDGSLRERCDEALRAKCLTCGESHNVNDWAIADMCCPVCSGHKADVSCDSCGGHFETLVDELGHEGHQCKSVDQFLRTGRTAFPAAPAKAAKAESPRRSTTPRQLAGPVPALSLALALTLAAGIVWALLELRVIDLLRNHRSGLSAPTCLEASIQENRFGRAGALVRQLLTVGRSMDESTRAAVLAEIARQPKPDRGNRKAARHLLDQGLESFNRGAFAEAAQTLLEAHRADPLDVQIANDLAFAEIRAGKPLEAEAHLMHALTLAPNRGVAWFNLGELCSRKGSLDDAVLAYINTYRFSTDRPRTLKYLRAQASNDTDPALRRTAEVALNEIDRLMPVDGGPPRSLRTAPGLEEAPTRK